MDLLLTINQSLNISARYFKYAKKQSPHLDLVGSKNGCARLLLSISPCDFLRRAKKAKISLIFFSNFFALNSNSHIIAQLMTKWLYGSTEILHAKLKHVWCNLQLLIMRSGDRMQKAVLCQIDWLIENLCNCTSRQLLSGLARLS